LASPVEATPIKATVERIVGGVKPILVPYHLDEPRPGLAVPFAADLTVTTAFPDGNTWHRMAHLYDAVADAVAGAVTHGERPIVASGDCTTSLGVVAGLQRAGIDPAIVWFDAHGDLQTIETTASGYLGGMPLRILVGYRPELIARPLRLEPIAEERVVLVDARDLDPPEKEYLDRSAIRRSSVAGLSEDVLPSGPLYIHLDCDVVDPADLPGLLYPAPGGPSIGAVAEAVRLVVGTGRVAALGLACTWRDGHNAAERVRAAFGAF
jgi:arginase